MRLSKPVLSALALLMIGAPPSLQEDLFPIEVGWAWHYQSVTVDNVRGTQTVTRHAVYVVGRTRLKLNGKEVDAFELSDSPRAARRDAGPFGIPSVGFGLAITFVGGTHAIVEDEVVKIYANGGLLGIFPRRRPPGATYRLTGIGGQQFDVAVSEGSDGTIGLTYKPCRQGYCESYYLVLQRGIGLQGMHISPSPVAGVPLVSVFPLSLVKVDRPKR